MIGDSLQNDYWVACERSSNDPAGSAAVPSVRPSPADRTPSTNGAAGVPELVPLGACSASPALGASLSVALELLIQREVGRKTLAALSAEVRRIMLMEAVRRHSGNLTRAARTLGLSRQAVQQMVTAHALRPWASQLRTRRPSR